MNIKKLIKSKSNSFDADRVIETPDGRELISTEMVQRKCVDAAMLELKEISTDENVQVIHMIDDYFIKLDRDEARIKFERALLAKKRVEFAAVRDAKYGRVQSHIGGEMLDRLGEYAEGLDPKALMSVAGILAAIILVTWFALFGFRGVKAEASAEGVQAVQTVDSPKA